MKDNNSIQNAPKAVDGTMQPTPPIGYTPSPNIIDQPAAAGMSSVSPSVYPPPSYNLPSHYDGTNNNGNSSTSSSMPSSYSRDVMFSNSTTPSSSSLPPFGGISDISSPLYPGVLNSPYHSPHPLHIPPPHSTSGLLNYATQSGIQPPSQSPHLFASPSAYGGYPNPLPVGVPPGQSMAERYLLPPPSHMMSR